MGKRAVTAAHVILKGSGHPGTGEGFFLAPSNIPDYLIWGYHIAPHTYSFRVFMHNEFRSIANFSSPATPTGLAVLEYYEMESVDETRDLVVLLLYALGFQLAFAAALHFLHTGKR